MATWRWSALGAAVNGVCGKSGQSRLAMALRSGSGTSTNLTMLVAVTWNGLEVDFQAKTVDNKHGGYSIR
jgi:hypothetical protein